MSSECGCLEQGEDENTMVIDWAGCQECNPPEGACPCPCGCGVKRVEITRGNGGE